MDDNYIPFPISYHNCRNSVVLILQLRLNSRRHGFDSAVIIIITTTIIIIIPFK